MKKVIDADPSIKLIFLCSPGNPTGTLIPLASIRALLEYPNFKGIVVIDEAYIDFSPSGSSALELVKEFANICVMQTLSKSFGLAAIRFVFPRYTCSPCANDTASLGVQIRTGICATAVNSSSHEYQSALQYIYTYGSPCP
jgi:bifunctional pyridoxal-dependent enzyme with beta-cystathionase and maltose regulon repressor activities